MTPCPPDHEQVPAQSHDKLKSLYLDHCHGSWSCPPLVKLHSELQAVRTGTTVAGATDLFLSFRPAEADLGLGAEGCRVVLGWPRGWMFQAPVVAQLTRAKHTACLPRKIYGHKLTSPLRPPTELSHSTTAVRIRPGNRIRKTNHRLDHISLHTQLLWTRNEPPAGGQSSSPDLVDG
jgi:hypothetical protein